MREKWEPIKPYHVVKLHNSRKAFEASYSRILNKKYTKSLSTLIDNFLKEILALHNKEKGAPAPRPTNVVKFVGDCTNNKEVITEGVNNETK